MAFICKLSCTLCVCDSNFLSYIWHLDSKSRFYGNLTAAGNTLCSLLKQTEKLYAHSLITSKGDFFVTSI